MSNKDVDAVGDAVLGAHGNCFLEFKEQVRTEREAEKRGEEKRQ